MFYLIQPNFRRYQLGLPLKNSYYSVFKSLPEHKRSIVGRREHCFKRMMKMRMSFCYKTLITQPIKINPVSSTDNQCVIFPFSARESRYLET